MGNLFGENGGVDQEQQQNSDFVNCNKMGGTLVADMLNCESGCCGATSNGDLRARKNGFKANETEAERNANGCLKVEYTIERDFFS